MNNFDWLTLVPRGWEKLACELIKECEAIDPTYEIHDIKEKWGQLYVISSCSNDKFEEIEILENRYARISKSTCCSCGKPATKISISWILPWCDNCGTDEEKYYKRLHE